MSDDWDASDNEDTKPKVSAPGKAAVATPAVPVLARKKFEGEDEEEQEGSGDDWDVSDSEKPKKVTPVASGSSAPAAAPKKKGTLKAKLAEKEAMKAAGPTDDLIDEETPQERRRREQRMIEEADAASAADLLGGTSLGDSININTLLTANPTKKDELSLLASQISTLLFDRLASNPQYAHFATEICKLVVQPCRDVDVRKAATALGVVANEKVQEAKDKASGKKKAGAKGKPALGLGKNATATKADTAAYEEALDDDLDFM